MTQHKCSECCPAGNRHKEDEDNRRERIHRVMQNLGEQMCPEDFEPKTEEACAHGDEPQPPKLCGWNRVFQRRLFLRCCFLAIADQDCNESSGQAGTGRNAIACTHADQGGKANGDSRAGLRRLGVEP